MRAGALVLSLALVVAALAACAPRAALDGDPLRTETVSDGAATVRVRYAACDADAAKKVALAVERALPRAQRWGALRAPIVITVHPDHDALEQAVHREGYDWLRAWARYASIDLQSPRTWSGRGWSIFGPDQAEIDELLLHELTHCVMYQLAGSDWSWPFKEIPLWFREGMASFTARQGYRWKSVQDVSRFYASSAAPGSGGGLGAARPRAASPARRGDPLTDPEPLYQTESHVVYGTAHLAFEFLVERYGVEAVRRLLARMGEGHLFATAFERAVGIAAREFEREFRRYVLWGGWGTFERGVPPRPAG
jgi:hypothetical protein